MVLKIIVDISPRTSICVTKSGEKPCSLSVLLDEVPVLSDVECVPFFENAVALIRMLEPVFGENVFCGGEVRDRKFGIEIHANEEDGKRFRLSCTGPELLIRVVNTLDREFVLSVAYLHWLNQTMGDVVAYSTQHLDKLYALLVPEKPTLCIAVHSSINLASERVKQPISLCDAAAYAVLRPLVAVEYDITSYLSRLETVLPTPIINTLADICSSTPPELFHFVNIPERVSYIPAPFEFSVEALQVLVNESPAKSVKMLAAIRSMTDPEEIDELFTAETGHALFTTCTVRGIKLFNSPR